jgi:hypothetical protein
VRGLFTVFVTGRFSPKFADSEPQKRFFPHFGDCGTSNCAVHRSLQISSGRGKWKKENPELEESECSSSMTTASPLWMGGEWDAT